LALVFAAIGLIVFKSLHAAAAGALAVLGHWGLDYLVHDADLPVLPYAKSVLAGPALGFNPEAPWQGLNATLPWLGYALQVIVVLICYRAFVQAYRPTARWVLIGALVFLNLAALPIFLQGAMSEIVTSTSGLVLGTLTDMLLASLVLYGAVRFAVPGAIPRLGPTSEALRTRLRGLQTGGALLALILGISHLAQGMWDGATNPSLAHWSTAFGIAYVLSGWTLFGPSPMALWTAFFLPILSGPLSRLFLGAGHLGLVHLALEIALATTAVYTIYKLKTSKLRI